MDDGFFSRYSTFDLNILKNILNNLHPTKKITVEPEKFDNISKTMIINFLEITVLLHENGCVRTGTFYKLFVVIQSQLLTNHFSMQNYKIRKVNQQIIKTFYLFCLHIIQTLISEI